MYLISIQIDNMTKQFITSMLSVGTYFSLEKKLLYFLSFAVEHNMQVFPSRQHSTGLSKSVLKHSKCQLEDHNNSKNSGNTDQKHKNIFCPNSPFKLNIYIKTIVTVLHIYAFVFVKKLLTRSYKHNYYV